MHNGTQSCINHNLIIPVGSGWCNFNTLRPRQKDCHFADNVSEYIFLNENAWILNKFSLKYVLNSQINNIPTLIQAMAWRWSGDKPLSETMMINSPTHIGITRPQRVNTQFSIFHWLLSSECLMIMPWNKCHRTSMIKLQHWFWQWFDAVTQLAITWTSVAIESQIHITPLGHNDLTHWGRDKMDVIFQMTYSNWFSWMKMYEFLL